MDVTINTKLFGVSFNDRQVSIRNLVSLPPGHVFGWKREPDNKFDRNSIVVFSSVDSDVEIGHISRELASKLAPLVDAGKNMVISLKEITGKNKQTLGVNVLITVETGLNSNGEGEKI